MCVRQHRRGRGASKARLSEARLFLRVAPAAQTASRRRERSLFSFFFFLFFLKKNNNKFTGWWFKTANPGRIEYSEVWLRLASLRGWRWWRWLLQVRVLFGFVDGPEFLHVFLDIFLRLVFHVLVALQILRILAIFQFLVHDAVSQLRGRGGAGNTHRYSQ